MAEEYFRQGSFPEAQRGYQLIVESTNWARSPLSLVGNVTTPTLVVVGSEDYRTPVSEAEQYYTALQLRNVPTMLVKVPGASHGGIVRSVFRIIGGWSGDMACDMNVPQDRILKIDRDGGLIGWL